MDFKPNSPSGTAQPPTTQQPREPNKILVWLQNFARKNTAPWVIFVILLIVGLVLLTKSFSSSTRRSRRGQPLR